MIQQIIHQISDALSNIPGGVLTVAALGVEWLCRRLPTEKSIGVIASVRGALGAVKAVVDELDRLVGVVDKVVEAILPENQSASLPPQK
jgi:hypothetical protein